MSIRRQSCEVCFRARRKCDRSLPRCGRCHRNNKFCHYAYPPQVPDKVAYTVANKLHIQSSTVNTIAASSKRPAGSELLLQTQCGWLVTGQANILPAATPSEAPRLPARLPSISAWKLDACWVFDEIRNSPRAFANQAGTMFIHKELFSTTMAAPLQRAFILCSGINSRSGISHAMMFKLIDAEISEWFALAAPTTLVENLAKLQAVVLYQIIRLFYGDLEERAKAEKQEFIVRSCGLKLIQGINIELSSLELGWEAWILVESIRRTVIISFTLYTLYGAFRCGRWTETAAIKMLPVSTMIGSWSSREVYLQDAGPDQLTTYADFAAVWMAKPVKRELDSFEKIVLAGSSGLDCSVLLRNRSLK